MALTGMHYQGLSALGDQSVSVEYNFAPAGVVAQASLSVRSGAGRCMIGITHYRYRDTPEGADHVVDFPWSPTWGFPPAVSERAMSSVTAELRVSAGVHAWAVATLNVLFF